MKYFFKTRLGETRYLLADGSLLCEGVPIARTGSQLYAADDLPDIEPDADGEIVVTRSPEQVFSAKSIASFEGMTVVILHPEDSSGDILFVDPTNWQGLAQGHAQNVRRGTGDQVDLLLADLIIKNEAAIRAINAGLREISCGYDADYEQTDVGKADQINIVGNHIALVPDGRAGKRCSIGDSKNMASKNKGWFAKLKRAIKTNDAATAEELMDNAPDTLTGDDDLDDTPTIVVKVEGPEAALPVKELTGDEAGSVEERLGALETMVKTLIEKLTPASPTGDENTTEEDDREEKKLTGDSAYHQDVSARAELILPGFSMPEGAKLGTLKRQVLGAAYKTTDGKSLISPLAGTNTDFMKLPIATVDSIFNGASEIARVRNNAKQSVFSLNMTEHANSIADLNTAKRDFWNNKGAK